MSAFMDDDNNSKDEVERLSGLLLEKDAELTRLHAVVATLNARVTATRDAARSQLAELLDATLGRGVRQAPGHAQSRGPTLPSRQAVWGPRTSLRTRRAPRPRGDPRADALSRVRQ